MIGKDFLFYLLFRDIEILLRRIYETKYMRNKGVDLDKKKNDWIK